MTAVPPLRLRSLNDKAPRPEGQFVLYWMVAFRRLGWNFALQHAVELARQYQRPLLVVESLRCDYPWASDRLHSFLLDGMADNARLLRESPVSYHPYVEPRPGAGEGLIPFLARSACAIVSDDFPCFILPDMLQTAAAQSSVAFTAVDSNGILPLRATETLYPSAYAFRRFLQKNLVGPLLSPPQADPLHGQPLPELKQLPEELHQRWPACPVEQLQKPQTLLAELPLDHSVPPVDIKGGPLAAREAMEDFLQHKLSRYAAERNEPEADVTSGLSPYLHFGHISAHQIVHELLQAQDWSPHRLESKPRGQKEGWWGLDVNAEAFLDQLITWRELGFNMCAHNPKYDRYESLPPWVRASLETHADDPRQYLYTLDEFAAGATHDLLWNAAQRQLVREGRMHNYLRMLWGKKILEWTRHPRQALEVMIELNNRYALDGCDPNSTSGIFWCLGRYDRPWGERPIFGKIRTMSSERTAKKVQVRKYLETYGK
ncbi:FAD-binding domain-containing protein [Desulfuromonas sp. AOP6]|uniref:FAD-binding domain-containing protein n=1 Tax=Desulfuromonas sp. AOP6 TaxID=1566351 RepID=UPI00126CA4EC|nr:FAD-binding domain-containing protein [Desulfuromonas sp. AOP6]BCA80641.1 deoxyribodipyrimidine photo-lyase [Desulfuromonas sp. AOP6]